MLFSIVLLSFTLLTPTNTVAQSKKSFFRYSICKNGYWGDWGGSNGIHKMMFNGSYDRFIIHDNYFHPSEYIMKVVINNFQLDTNKKSKRQRIKNNTWYEYTGTVEYYTELTFQNFGDLAYTWPQVSWNTSTGKKHIVNAKIIIAPYEDYPKVYNIFFENLGIGIRPLE